ncbi:MAG: hypothetical protein M3Q00_04025, partial [Pseudomonadota bacterium]|nr:hypothetical protein [Pseudomonadota bacterium]
GIGARDNPHGATYADNPNNLRVCLAKMDPRQRGLFSAAWTLGYVSTLARAGVANISMGAPTGPLGMIYREAEHTQPFFDDLETVAVYPVFHTLSALNRASGNLMLSISCSDIRTVACFGWNDKSSNVVMIANLTANEQIVELSGIGADATIGMLDEDSFVTATTNPKAFRKAGRLLGDAKPLRLGGYAVAYVSY